MTTNLLKSYFPMIQSREEILARIYSNPKLQQLFESWTVLQQIEFLDFCSGAARDVESLKGSHHALPPVQFQDSVRLFLSAAHFQDYMLLLLHWNHFRL